MHLFTTVKAYGWKHDNKKTVHTKSTRIFLLLFLLMGSFFVPGYSQGPLPACDVISAGPSNSSVLRAHVNQQVTYSANLVNNTGANYMWEFTSNTSGASIASGQGTLHPVINAGTSVGQYTLKLTTTTPAGTTSCSSSLVVECLTPTIMITPITCFGTTATLSVTASGGTAPYVYTLQPGNISNSNGIFSGLSAGTYTLDISSALPGCTSTSTVVINGPTAALSATTTQTNVACFGNSTGAIDLTVNGGTAPYTYSWLTAAGGVIPAGQADDQDLSGLVPGTYRVFVTDSSGCGTMATVFITQPAQALTAPFVQVNPGCGDSIGIINLNPFGGTAPYTYSWTAASGGVIPAGQEDDQDLYGIMGGTYTVVVTDAAGCTYTNAAIILQTVGATSTQVNVGCFGDSTGMINLNVSGGVLPYTYAWTATNGGYVPTAQAANEDLNSLPAGTYHVEVMDVNGCHTSTDVVISQTATALAATATQINAGCFGSSTGSIDLSVSGGTAPYTYSWLAAAGGVIPAGQSTNQDLNGLTAGTYRVFVTDSNACSAIVTVMITQAASLATTYVQVNPGCDSTGTINLTVAGGTAPYSYVWTATNGGVVPAGQVNTQDLYNVVSGTYTVVVTDAAGCTTTTTIVLTQGPATITTSFTQVNPGGCSGAATGSIDLTVNGGSAPFTYAWTASNGGVVPAGQAGNQDLTGLVAGQYNVVVISSTGCSASRNVILTNSGSGLSVIATPTNILCFGNATGAINVLVNGGSGQYTFNWTAILGGTIPAGQVNNQNLTGLTAGVYTVFVTDASGCSGHKTVIVWQPLPIILSAIPSCSNGAGSINLSVFGGNSPYTYVWTASNGGVVPAGQVNNQDLTGLVGGSYAVVVTSANGCTAMKTFTVNCSQSQFGCSHGFWKNHPQHWNNSSTYTVSHMPANMSFITTTNFFSYFNIAPGTAGLPNNLTMMGALQLQGGHCKAFSRDAVTALLDVASGQNVPFPAGTNDFGSLYTAIRNALLNSNCDGSLRAGLHAIVNHCHDDDDNDRLNETDNNVVTVAVYPNPFNASTGKLTFKLKSEVAGNASFELFDLSGMKVGVLFNGYLDKNVEKIVTYNVPFQSKKTLLYRLQIGNKVNSGKVLFLN